MRIVFWIWGGFGFLICGFGTFFAINPSTPALMAVSTVLLMWIGGMVLFGLFRDTAASRMAPDTD